MFEVTSHHHHLEIIENFKLFIKSDNEDEFSVGRLGENSSIGEANNAFDYNLLPGICIFWPFPPWGGGEILSKLKNREEFEKRKGKGGKRRKKKK